MMSENQIKRQKLNTPPIQPDLYRLKYTLKDQHEQSVNSVKVSPDGRVFASCSSDKFIRVFDLKTGELVKKIQAHSKGISDICFSPINSNYIASCSDDMTIKLWNLGLGKCIKVFRKHTYHVTTIRFNHKGNMLISGSSDETITIWDVKSGRVLKTLAAHSDPISSIDMTYDSSIIVSGSYDGLIRLFDVDTGQCLKTLIYDKNNTSSTFPISYVQCSPNGKYILSSSLDGVIRLWDYMNNKVVKTFFGQGEEVVSEKFNCGTRFITRTSNPLIVSGTQNSKIIIWDVQTKEIVTVLNHSEVKGSELDPVFDVSLWNDGELLVSCSKSGVVNVWEMNEQYYKTEKEESEKEESESDDQVVTTFNTPEIETEDIDQTEEPETVRGSSNGTYTEESVSGTEIEKENASDEE